jgi:hypothetical protein
MNSMIRERKKFLRGSNIYWLEQHQEVVEKFRDTMIDFDSYGDFEFLVNDKPSEFATILRDFSRRMQDKVDELIGYLRYGKSKILYVVGARDSGKTCFSFWLAEKIHELNKHIKIAYVGVRLRDDVRPKWCSNYDELGQVPNGSLVILDELAIQYNARRHADERNVNLGQLLAIARHKDLSVIAITQDPNMGEINVWRLKDMVVYKRSNTYELPDRDSKGSRTSKIIQFWRFIKNWLKPTRQEQALFEYQSKSRVMLFVYDLPQCWSEQLSKAFNLTDVFGDKTNDAGIKSISKKERLLELSPY